MDARNQLSKIFTDMTVIDVDGACVGSVQNVYCANTIPVGILPEDAHSKAQLIAAMGGDKPFPVPILTRLYHHGFFRVAWLLKQDKFILPEQVLDVMGAIVHLNCSSSDLIQG